MKFSSKIEKCGLSPMRKFAPYANEAAKKGKKLYHLNIGQPDIATPAAYFEAVKNFSQPVLAYAPSDGVPEMIDAVVNYYGKIEDRAQLHSRRGRRDHHPRAVLPELQHVRHADRRNHPPNHHDP